MNNEDSLLQSVIAGFFALIFASPLLAFWRGGAKAKAAVFVVLTGSFGLLWRRLDLDHSDDARAAMFALSVIPAAAAAGLAGLIELTAWLRRKPWRRHLRPHSQHPHRRRAQSRHSL